MDLNDFWQENKRFVLAVLGAVIVFFTGLRIIDAKFHQRTVRQRASITRKRQDLAQPLFGQSDLTLARKQAAELDEALAHLAPRVEFRPRTEFVAGDTGASINGFYFGVASDVREDLLQLAGRANLRLPENLGLPASVVDEDEIARYLEGLDVVDRVVRLAVEAGVERIDEIRMRLDPRLLSGRQFDTFEEHAIEFEMSGASGPLVRLLALSQEPRRGADPPGPPDSPIPPDPPDPSGPLVMGKVELKSARAKRGEARLLVTFLVTHLHGIQELAPAEVDS